MGKPYRTTATYALAAIVAPPGDHGVERTGAAALAGLWDTGGEAHIGERKSVLFRLPRVTADELHLWLPIHWTAGVVGKRAVTRVECAYLDVGHTARPSGAVATVYAVRPGSRHDLPAVRLFVDVESGEVRTEPL